LIGNDSGNDIDGNDANNLISGGLGNDFLGGMAGNDTVNGDEGDDFLYGNSGNDTLYGGVNYDNYLGGTGADTFLFKTLSDLINANATQSGTMYDAINDFSSLEQDKIDISAIDANVGLAGNQAFVFINTSAFSSVPGQLRFADQAVYGDINGDSVADFLIYINGVNSMTANDFIL
jgi:serralysin